MRYRYLLLRNDAHQKHDLHIKKFLSDGAPKDKLFILVAILLKRGEVYY
jgi:hypothetical protein